MLRSPASSLLLAALCVLMQGDGPVRPVTSLISVCIVVSCNGPEVRKAVMYSMSNALGASSVRADQMATILLSPAYRITDRSECHSFLHHI